MEFTHFGEDYQGVSGVLPPPLRVEIRVLKSPLSLP